MKVNKETLELWNSLRYHKCVNELAEHLNVTQRTIYNALTKGYCSESNQIKITEFLKSKQK